MYTMEPYEGLKLQLMAALSDGNQSLANDITLQMYPYMEYMEEARRQLFITQAKKLILEHTPKSFDVKTFALTVCPESSEDHRILDEIAKLVNSISAVLTSKYVYEQRSKVGENTYGWHVHFYIQTTYRLSKLKQFAQQKLKKISHILDVRPADERYLTRYMAGDKNDSDKNLKVDKDRILRAQLGLQAMYEYVK